MIVERFEFGKNKKESVETEQATDSPKFSQGFTQKEQPSFQQHQPGAFDDVPF